MGDGGKGEDTMKIKENEENEEKEEKEKKEKAVICVSGRIDSSTAPELDAFISERLNGLKELVLDVSEVDYMSSAGLRVLLSAHKGLGEEKDSVTVIGANDDVDEVLHITGFDTFINVEESDEEASKTKKTKAKKLRKKGEDTRDNENRTSTTNTDAE